MLRKKAPIEFLSGFCLFSFLPVTFSLVAASHTMRMLKLPAMFLDNGLRSPASAVAAGKGQLTALRLLLKSKIDVNAEVAAFYFTLMEFNAALNFAGQGEANSASNGFE